MSIKYKRRLLASPSDSTNISASSGVQQKIITSNVDGFNISSNLTRLKIGDYVDMGVQYENQVNFHPEYVINSYSDNGPTGFRIIGIDCLSIYLISSGCPFSYTFQDIRHLSLVTETFDNPSFKELLCHSEFYPYIDNPMYSSLYGFYCQKMTTAYSNITGIQDINFSSNYSFQTGHMLSSNREIDSHAFDLLGNGMSYIFLNYYDKIFHLNLVEESGKVHSFNYESLSYRLCEELEYLSKSKKIGIRVSFSLPTEFKILSGDGASLDTAYKIKY